MTKRELRYLKMVITRTGVMEANTTIWSGNLKISNAKNKVGSIYAQVLVDAGIQEEDITGSTEAKNEAWINAAVLGVHICTGMRAYAHDIGDESLYEMMHYTKTDLENGEIVKVLNRMTLIFNQASIPPIASLLPFNITGANLTDYNLAIQAMTAALPKHGVLKAGRITSTKNIKVNLKNLREAGKVQDDLVHTLALTQPAFVQTYDNASRIGSTGRGQMAVELHLMPGEIVAVFYKKFLPGDTFTARNHSELSVVKLLLNDTPAVPATGGVELYAGNENQLTVPDSFKMVFGHYLIVENLDKFDDAHITIVLAHGKSHSSAAAPINVVVPTPPSPV